MNRPIQWLLMTVVAATFNSAVPADEPPRPAASPAPVAAAKVLRLPYPYDKLNLTDEQKVQIAGKLRDKRTEIIAWETEFGVRRLELKQAITEARAAHDDEKTKAIYAEGVAIDKERQAIEDKYQAEIDAILTLEQHQELEGFGEYPVMLQRLGRVKPSDKQKGEVRARVMKAAAEAYGKDLKTKNEVWGRVRVDIERNVLTPEQRLLLKPAPTTHPHAR